MLQSFPSRILLAVLFILSGSNATAQSIKVLSPNGGEVWEAGSTQTISWESSGINDELEIEFTDNGSNWRRIARVSANTTQVSWTVDNRPSEIVQVRVITKDEDVSDVSDGVFTITPDPLDQTILLSPNGGEVLTEGTQHLIRWQLPLDAIDALLEYSTNFGVNWTTINTVPAPLGQYSWTVPDVGVTTVTTAVVRVSMAEALDHFDISDAAFTIQPKATVTPSALSVTYPDGGEVLSGGSTINVSWSYMPGTNDDGEDEGPELMVQYSTNNGSTWGLIATEDAKDGSHSWLVPNVSTTEALVRVIQIGGTLGDTSDATFTIDANVGTNTVRVVSPNGGEVWREGEMHKITWTNQGENGEAKIYLETTDQQSTVKKAVLATIAASTGSISWTVPNLGEQPLQARIIIEANGLEDMSDGPCVILPEGSLGVSRSANDRFEFRGFYPNPAQNMVTFRWTQSGKSAVVAKLYNSSGAVIRTTSVSGNSSRLSMEIRDLPQGAYFYELLTDGHIAHGVLTIQR